MKLTLYRLLRRNGTGSLYRSPPLSPLRLCFMLLAKMGPRERVRSMPICPKDTQRLQATIKGPTLRAFHGRTLARKWAQLRCKNDKSSWETQLIRDRAFPTQFNAYPAGYTWDGTLSTVDKAGKSVCATASSSYVPYSPYATPTQHNIVDSLQGEDGILYHLAMESNGGPADQSINPNDAAPKSCSTPGFAAPASAIQSAQFLTVTSTSHEASTPTSTPQKSTSSPTVTKPRSQVSTTSKTGAVTSTCTSADCDDTPLPKPIITCDKNFPEDCPTPTPPPPPPVTSTCTSANCDNDDDNPLPKPIITSIACNTDYPDLCPTSIYTTIIPPIMLNGTMYSATPLGTVAPKGNNPGTTTMGYVLPGATLAPGSTITFGSGLMAQTVVLRTGSSKTQLEVDGSTSVLPTGTPVKIKETGMSEGQTAQSGGRTGIAGDCLRGRLWCRRRM